MWFLISLPDADVYFFERTFRLKRAQRVIAFATSGARINILKRNPERRGPRVREVEIRLSVLVCMLFTELCALSVVLCIFP